MTWAYGLGWRLVAEYSEKMEKEMNKEWKIFLWVQTKFMAFCLSSSRS